MDENVKETLVDTDDVATNSEENQQSYILGQFVAIGHLMEETCQEDMAQHSLYTHENLDIFFRDLEKNMPLYLDELVKLQKSTMDKGKDGLVAELYELYHKMPNRSCVELHIDQNLFMKGYFAQLEEYKEKL